MAGRRPRPFIMSFDPVVLADHWAPLARLPDIGFNFDGTSYGSTTRGSPDEIGLDRHVLALQSLLSLCPSGFPSQISLQATFEMLQDQGLLWGSEVRANKKISLAAEQWRIMAKHVYNLALAGHRAASPRVQSLVALIKLRAESSSESSLARPAGEDATEPSLVVDADALPVGEVDDGVLVLSSQQTLLSSPRSPAAESRSPSSPSVELCSMFCQCPDCMKSRAVIIGDVTEPFETVPDKTMDELLRVPSASIGGQRRETLEVVALMKRPAAKPTSSMQALTKRLRKKTTVKFKVLKDLDDWCTARGRTAVIVKRYDPKAKSLEPFL